MNYNNFIAESKIENFTCVECNKILTSENLIAFDIITRQPGEILIYDYKNNILHNKTRENKKELAIDDYKNQLKNTSAREKVLVIHKNENGEIIETADFEKIDGAIYCVECIENLFRICENCDEYIPKDNAIEIDGDFYCEECENELFVCCEKCKDRILADDAIEIDGHYYCGNSCANDAGFYKCDDCNNWYNAENSGGVNCNEDGICDACTENYYACEICNCIVHRDDVCTNDNGECICETCYNENNCALIHDYSFTPELSFKKMVWENTLYLGLEFELETSDGDINEKAKKIGVWIESKNLEKTIFMKHDSSIENGVEIIFQPHTLKALHKKFPLYEFFKFLKDIKLTGYENGRCGFHVHLSKKHFSKNNPNGLLGEKSQAHKLKLFFWKTQDYLKKFSQRKDFHYCKFPEEKPVNGENVNGRYEAVNTTSNYETFEIRLFRGTTDIKRIIATIQFCDAVSYYIINTSFNSIAEKNAPELWQDFLDYCKRENRYHHFVKYIFEKKII
jgi:hypothetical protein